MAALQPWLRVLLPPTRRHLYRWHLGRQPSPKRRCSFSSRSSRLPRCRLRSGARPRHPSLPQVSRRAAAPPMLLLVLLLQARRRQRRQLLWRPWRLRPSAESRWFGC